ncbi:MAG TPA: serine/threonine-protein kinase [Chloroflexota bacterium]|nr:serine/threonine-protein kinase [Chloroflexota bacterium]
MNLPAGHKLGGFQIVAKIGRGAMGTVYRARQVALERDVALKVLDTQEDPAAFERFRREAIQVANLKHPNILPVFDFGQHDDVTYIAMELADGGTLAAQIGQPMAPLKAVQILKPAAQAIDYAHQANVVHRDVKPANLLFDANGRLFLSDFGLALMRDAKSSTWGQMVGTPWYMAPEQFRSKAEPASDVYSLAVTLFQLLTGRVPFDRENPLAIALAHLKDPIPSAREMNPDVPEMVDRVLRRGMAKEPSQRYARAIELLAAVAGTLKDAASAAPLQAARPATPGFPALSAAASPARPAAGSPPPRGAPAPAAGTTSRPPAAATAAVGGQAPAPGPVIFETKPTPEWARANLILRDSKAGRLNVNDGLIELTMSPPNQAQLMMLQAGQREDVWAELQFGVAPASGIFDILWHEGVEQHSYCARVDTQQGRVAIGLVPATGSGSENWLTTRNVGLGPGTEHTLLLVSSKGSIQTYLDGKGVVSVNDSTLSKGMVRLRLLPAPQNPRSTLLLRRLAIFRPPS